MIGLFNPDRSGANAREIERLKALVDRLTKERDAAVAKFEITHEALVEARERMGISRRRR